MSSTAVHTDGEQKQLPMHNGRKSLLFFSLDNCTINQCIVLSYSIFIILHFIDAHLYTIAVWQLFY